MTHNGRLEIRRLPLTNQPKLHQLGYGHLVRCSCTGETSCQHTVPIHADWVSALDRFLRAAGMPPQGDRVILEQALWICRENRFYFAPVTADNPKPSTFFQLDNGALHPRENVDLPECVEFVL